MIRVQGYALPWDQPAYVDGLVETVAPRAVSCDTVRNLKLLAVTHEEVDARIYAETKRGNLRFWQDDYGLAFSAQLDDNTFGRGLAHSIRSGLDGCSVLFSHMRRREDGRIIWATIDHVTLTASPAYRDTGVWLAGDPIRDRPAHLRDMSAAWLEGLRAHLKNTGRSAARGPQPGRSARGANAWAAPARVPTSLMNLMSSPDWEEARAANAQGLRFFSLCGG